jgi:hypothetical protein
MNIFKLTKLPWDASISADDFLRVNAWVISYLIGFGFLSFFVSLIWKIFSKLTLAEHMFTNIDIFTKLAFASSIAVVVFIGLLFIFIYLKLIVLRIHDFNQSGWLVIPLLTISILLNFLPPLAQIVGLIVSGIITYALYFIPAKLASPYPLAVLPPTNYPRFERVLIFCSSIIVLYGILSEPIFAVINIL